MQIILDILIRTSVCVATQGNPNEEVDRCMLPATEFIS